MRLFKSSLSLLEYNIQYRLLSQLYKKQTHFLLNLISNADENTFKSDILTISMTLNTTTSFSIFIYASTATKLASIKLM